MMLSNRAYDILKWLDLVIIPAAATFYRAVGAVWGWPLGDEVAATAAAVCTLIGTVIGISTAEYNKES